MKLQKYDEGIPEGHAFAETRKLHPADIRLRANGFKIYSRPQKGLAQWSIGGKVYTESDALALCVEEVK